MTIKLLGCFSFPHKINFRKNENKCNLYLMQNVSEVHNTGSTIFVQKVKNKKYDQLFNSHT